MKHGVEATSESQIISFLKSQLIVTKNLFILRPDGIAGPEMRDYTEGGSKTFQRI